MDFKLCQGGFLTPGLSEPIDTVHDSMTKSGYYIVLLRWLIQVN